MSPTEDDLGQLAASLSTVRLARVHEHHAELGSTNDRGLAWLGEGAPDGALVTADSQTAGRGRLGRSWQSPPGRDIYASVLLRPGAPRAEFGALALAVGLGLHKGLHALFAPDLPSLALKWPNDVLVDGRKLAGILCESRWRGQELQLVIGFGINVHREIEQFEPSLRARATSLAIALGRPVEHGRARILAKVLQQLEATLERFFVAGFGGIRAEYEAQSVVLGREIEVVEPDGSKRIALALGLDVDGALLARPLAGGASFRVQSADVWLR